MPEFYQLTASKLYAVIFRILKDSDAARWVLTELYRDLFKRSRDKTFQPDWFDLIKLARRHTLDYASAGEHIPRAVATSGESTPRSPLDPNQIAILEQVINSDDPAQQKALRTLKSGLKTTPEKGGAS